MSFKLMKKNSDILIKVLSLGIGLAVGIVLIAKVFFELSYDSLQGYRPGIHHQYLVLPPGG